LSSFPPSTLLNGKQHDCYEIGEAANVWSSAFTRPPEGGTPSHDSTF
jgi:hypothetical protein